MDEEVNEQLNQKGKDAFFGSEKTLYIGFKSNSWTQLAHLSLG